MISIQECQICGNKAFEKIFTTNDFFFSGESFDIARCPKCGFTFTNPIPEKSKLSKYYQTDKYLSHDTANSGIMGKLYGIIRNQNLTHKLKLIKKFKTSGKLLDIGSGTGEFLNHMKENGFQTLGIEPEQKARSFAINNFNLDIRKEEDLDSIEERKFDVVTMWHVLEHVDNLNKRMQKVNRILKKDGVFVNALPMIDSPDALKFGKYWAGLDVPRHLQHFSAKTFELLATNNGFQIVDKFPMKFDSYYVSLLSHKAIKNSLAPIRGFIDGFKSNLNADKNSNYSSMIFVMKKS